MSGVFIELYLDEDIDVLLADLTRAKRSLGSSSPHADLFYELAKRVLAVLNAVTADEMQNTVRYI